MAERTIATPFTPSSRKRFTDDCLALPLESVERSAITGARTSLTTKLWAVPVGQITASRLSCEPSVQPASATPGRSAQGVSPASDHMLRSPRWQPV